MPNFPKLGNRLDAVSESLTLRLNALAKEMKQRGEPVINLTAGEPDFAVPEEAKQAVRDALNRNESKYTATEGIPELRKCVAEKTNRQQANISAPWSEKNVVVSNGGKQALFNAFMAIINPGDEVLIPAPYWLSYPEMVLIAGGIPVILPTNFENGFKISPADLRRAVTPRTRAIIFNSPSNPTGMMYTRAEFQALGKVLSEKAASGIWVVSDEIYDRIILGDQPFCSFLGACPDFQDRTVTVNGMSKSAAMTGWRIGWTVTRLDLSESISKLQGQTTSGINSLAQHASVAALKLPETAFSKQLDAYRRRRDIVLDILGKCEKIRVRPPDGAFYVFVGVESCFQAGEDSIRFSERILEQAKLAVVPGTPFGAPEFIRISFATDEKSLREGCQRLVQFVESQ